ncbi:MAG: InlB B-repeat-containing protein, partial [Marinilabiliaceae bacterium]|nr:InlB B-repeat-containing protein [Marinilabiliaceae bacterium]
MKKIKICFIIGISAILLIGCNKPDKPPQYYTVNFAGEGVDIEPQTVESGNHAVAPENPDRDCYCFDGWFT